MKRIPLLLLFCLIRAEIPCPTQNTISSPVTCPCELSFNYTPSTFTNNDHADFLILPHHAHLQNPNPILKISIRNGSFTQSSPISTNAPLMINSRSHFKAVLRAQSCSRISFTLRTTHQCPTVLPDRTGERPDARIVGGNIPHDSLHTHMVAFVKNDNFICSGSVISERWALTAAHCGINRFFVAIIGGAVVGRGHKIPVQSVITHPNYNRNRDDSPNDIALVRLTRDTPPGVVFVRLNVNSSLPVPGAYTRASGYGRTREARLEKTEHGRQSGPMLRQVDIPIVNMPKCKNYYSKASLSVARRLSDDLQLCAGLMEGGCDACQGDSGGPLSVFDAEGHVVQIGIVSFGIGCARENLPGAYTRVSAFAEWMRNNDVKFTVSENATNIFAVGSESAAADSEFDPAKLTTTQKVLIGVGVLALIMVVAFFTGASYLKRMARRGSNEAGSPAPSDVGSFRPNSYPDYYNEPYLPDFNESYRARDWVPPDSQGERGQISETVEEDTSRDMYIAVQMQADEDAAAIRMGIPAVNDVGFSYPPATDEEDSEMNLIVPRVSAELPSELYPESCDQEVSLPSTNTSEDRSE